MYRSREAHAAVRSDPTLVELILCNLVSNAIRCTGRGGVLMVCHSRRHGGRCRWRCGTPASVSAPQARATGLPLLHKPAAPAELHRSILAVLERPVCS